MSDLKHMSVEQLRAEVRSLSSARIKLESRWMANGVEIERLHAENKDLRSKHHNLGQREAWARIYLAKKDDGR